MIFKNVSRDDLDLPTLGLRVESHDTVEVTGDDAKALSSNPNFERVDEPKPRKSTDDEKDGD